MPRSETNRPPSPRQLRSPQSDVSNGRAHVRGPSHTPDPSSPETASIRSISPVLSEGLDLTAVSSELSSHDAVASHWARFVFQSGQWRSRYKDNQHSPEGQVGNDTAICKGTIQPDAKIILDEEGFLAVADV